MKQKVNTSIAGLVEAGKQVSAGAAIHAVSLGLAVATKPLVDADVNALTTAIDSLRQEKYRLRGLRTTLEEKRKEASDLAYVVRDLFKRSFGRTYNVKWEGTGFNQSLRIPEGDARLSELLRQVKSFLTDNPTYEVADLVTAEIVDTAVSALETASAATQVKESAVRGLVVTRKQKEKVLRNRIRWSIDELLRVLGPIDARWDAFGLNQPGIKQAPVAPEALVLTLVNGVIVAKWDKAARAEHYRIWLKVIGTDETASQAGTANDQRFDIEGIASGKQVEVAVSAVNNGGESQRSAAKLITVP